MESKARRSLCSWASSSSSCILSVSPEIPSKPKCLFSKLSTSWMQKPSFEVMNSTMAASRSPARVPMTRPSRGVRPMDVSTDLPSRIAVAEQPFPRCSVIMFVSSGDRFRSWR